MRRPPAIPLRRITTIFLSVFLATLTPTPIRTTVQTDLVSQPLLPPQVLQVSLGDQLLRLLRKLRPEPYKTLGCYKLRYLRVPTHSAAP